VCGICQAGKWKTCAEEGDYRTSVPAGRTIHGLAYDPVHDEIVVPNAWRTRFWFFAGVQRDEPPIRVISRPCTKLITPHSVSLASSIEKFWVASLTGKRINGLPLGCEGRCRATPVITGPRTQLGHLVGIAVASGSKLDGRSELGGHPRVQPDG